VSTRDSGATEARRAAVRILESCRDGRIFEHALDEVAGKLEERDRRLAHELAAGVLRNQTALDAMLAPLVSRDWKSVLSPLKQVLRLGAYQLTALDRIPVHAAVATSVSLARELSGARAGGFVNAVLRKLSSGTKDGNPVAPEIPGTTEELAATYSHPEWLVDRWIQRFGPGETKALLEWNDVRPRLAVQPARGSLESLTPSWRDQGFTVEPAPFGQGLYLDAKRPDELAGFSVGHFLVQDPAQSMVIRFAGISDGWVYDACAAPGGKSLALSHRGARVIAGDVNPRRLRRVSENLARAGTGHELVLVADALHPPLRPVDGVLLDAPCLGTGTFARHPDARWRVTPAALEELARQQSVMLDALALVVRPGGMLVYATCSLEPEENECQVDAFLTRNQEFRREPNPGIPQELLTPLGDLMILPQRHRMDGAYAARLRRSDR
jgi:16S rRNA (cytosine967-C5)-methyltransferase